VVDVVGAIVDVAALVAVVDALTTVSVVSGSDVAGVSARVPQAANMTIANSQADRRILILSTLPTSL
jgi:hypothetical protein